MAYTRFMTKRTIRFLLVRQICQVFEKQPTDASLRRQWCQEVDDKMHLTLDDVRPTKADVDTVLAFLPRSALGPDGIPFHLYGIKRPEISEIIYEVVLAILEGREAPDRSLNDAFLVCLPKSSMVTTIINSRFHQPYCGVGLQGGITTCCGSLDF